MKRRTMGLLVGSVTILMVGVLAFAALWQGSDPAGTTETQDSVLKPRSLLILGDSIADGYMDVEAGGQAVAREYCYGTLLQQALELDADRYDNQAVSGWTTTDLLTHLDEVTKHPDRPDMIALSIGGNDILQPLNGDPALLADLYAVARQMVGDTEEEPSRSLEERLRGVLTDKLAEISSRETYKQALQTACENLTAILNILLDRFPETTVVIQTLYNPLDKGEDDVIPLPALERLNEIICQTAAGYDRVEVLDVAACFAGKAKQYLSSDWIHPNREGHVQIAALYQQLWEPRIAVPTMSLGRCQTGIFMGVVLTPTAKYGNIYESI